MLRGIRNTCNSASSHSPLAKSISIVREAFVGSVTCAVRSDKFQINHESIFPNNRSPASARSRAPGVWSKIHSILLPEK